MSLTTKAMLVRMSIGKWYNRVNDKRLTDEIAAKYLVKNSEDQYVKRLIPSAALRAVEAVISEIRKYHYDHTLPWAQDSVRILPSIKHLDYMAKMVQYKAQFDQAVAAFVAKYPDWVEAARQEKKALFDASQYPSPQALKDLFRIDVSFLPFPDANDFRIQMDPVDDSRNHPPVDELGFAGLDAGHGFEFDLDFGPLGRPVRPEQIGCGDHGS